MIANVTDIRSNSNDQIAHAATVLKKSELLRKMFKTICSGGKKPKTVDELMNQTGFDQVKASQLARKLADNQLVIQTKFKNRVAYAKEPFYNLHKSKILRLATNPKKLKDLPTKINPKGASSAVPRIIVQGIPFKIVRITCDHIEQFAAVKKVKTAAKKVISEDRFKKGIQKIIGQTGVFKDWGGEKNDLYTSRVTIKGKRIATAFAFKGPGKKGELTPGKLGKNGDQIQRLFQTPAEVFFVQYHDRINESVVEQMEVFAKVKSISDNRKIYYGIIDGDDSNRLMAAYPKKF